LSLNKLVKRLRREAASSPKKLAVLALLAVVALWFWAPLLWGWFSPADKASASAEPGPTAEATTTTAATKTVAAAVKKGTETQKEETPRHPWQELVEWMNHDPLTAAAHPLIDPRDPFVAVKTEEEEQQEQIAETESQDVPKPLPAVVTPESLELALSSTIVGPRSRVARINGKTYRPGDTVKAGKDGQKIEFALVEVHPRKVVLERKGKQFDLAIPRPGNSDRIQLSAGIR